MESLLPFLQGTCTPYNMPVYPGAQCIIAKSLIDNGSVLTSASICGFQGRAANIDRRCNGAFELSRCRAARSHAPVTGSRKRRS